MSASSLDSENADLKKVCEPEPTVSVPRTEVKTESQSEPYYDWDYIMKMIACPPGVLREGI